MSGALPWLAGRRALLAGEGAARDAVGAALAAAGADVAISAIGPGDEDAIAGEMDRFATGGGIDILVHAGVAATAARATTYDLDAWRARVSADLDLRFLQSAEFARRRLAAGRGGSILFLMPGPVARDRHAAQGTIVGALDNLVKSLAVEWVRDGIRVNAIGSRACEPGGLGDAATAASLGHLAAYLSSDYANYISGMIMGLNEL